MHFALLKFFPEYFQSMVLLYHVYENYLSNSFSRMKWTLTGVVQ